MPNSPHGLHGLRGLRARGLSKRFGRAQVLNGVDLDVEPGSIVLLSGQNGAGKTTVLRIFATLLGPDAGSASVDGIDVAGDQRSVRSRVGLALVSDRGLYWRLSATENLIFFARTYGLNRADARRRAAEVCAMVGLEDIAHRAVSGYSTGQRQRLIMARALLGAPTALLVDEPMRGLDDEGKDRVREILRASAAGGAAVLVAAPTTDDLAMISDRILTIRDGKLVA